MGAPPLMTPPGLGGWTKSELVELADRRTERRGSKTLDLDSEFLMALHDFVTENRWSWRQKVTTLTLQAGVWQYDLTDQTGANAQDLQQFAKHGFKIYPNGNPQQWAEVTPLFERALQTAAVYSAQYGATPPSCPRQYFMMPGAFLILCVTPTPDRAYPSTLDYWAYHNITADSMPEQIPLVPAYLHHVLLKRLEANIFRYTLGEGAAKYQAAIAEYNALVDRYQGVDGFVSGEHQDYSEAEDYPSTFANAHDAVQSTV